MPFFGDEPGRLPYADGRQLSTEGRFVRQAPPGHLRRSVEVNMASGAKERDTAGRRKHAGRVEPSADLIGVGVIVVRGGAVLLGLRRGAHGPGTWSFPGGHLDRGESAEACALRELYEETGLEAANPRLVAETFDHFPEGLRYRTLFVRVGWAGGVPVVREPQRCEQWSWFSWDAPPTPLFLPVASLRAKGFRP
jgi:8-oxo-dGTP diphosphatase